MCMRASHRVAGSVNLHGTQSCATQESFDAGFGTLRKHPKARVGDVCFGSYLFRGYRNYCERARSRPRSCATRVIWLHRTTNCDTTDSKAWAARQFLGRAAFGWSKGIFHMLHDRIVELTLICFWVGNR
jgi:hypothetical protein